MRPTVWAISCRPLFATPSHVIVAISMPEPLRTHLHKWLCSERCLVCHRLASSSFQRSKLGRQPREPVGPSYHVRRAITWLQSPRATPRSHIAEWLCPTRLRPQRRADLSCEGEVSRGAWLSPRGATRDRTFARPNVANGSARERSVASL